MSTFDNPFNPSRSLNSSGCSCGRHINQAAHELDAAAQLQCVPGESEDKRYENVVASAVMRAIFPEDVGRRAFLQSLGASTALAALSQFFPLKTATEVFAAPGTIEKKDLKVGFIPITCATPIIMAKPMGFYEKPAQYVPIRAIRIAAEPASGLTVGAVVIAERHSESRSEAARLLAKGLEGCAYFISQTVYHAPPTEALLRDYLRDCRGAGIEPRRVVLTFAPCGRDKTLAFLRWLGVHIPPDTERAILGAARPLEKSIEICRDNLRRILEHPYAAEVPLGVNVESVSINRDEIDASIDLAHALKEILDQHVGR